VPHIRYSRAAAGAEDANTARVQDQPPIGVLTPFSPLIRLERWVLLAFGGMASVRIWQARALQLVHARDCPRGESAGGKQWTTPRC
jgi:hypothetical protein